MFSKFCFRGVNNTSAKNQMEKGSRIVMAQSETTEKNEIIYNRIIVKDRRPKHITHRTECAYE